MNALPWSRRLWIAGVVLLFAGLVDPLEGSVVIGVGSGALAVAAGLAGSAHRRWCYAGFALAGLGIAYLWGVSALGGFGGDSGRSWWWGLPLLTYPLGWVASLVGALKMRREVRPSAPSAPEA